MVNGGGDTLEKVQFSELQKPRDLDLDLDLGSVPTHTVVHQSSTSIYKPNFIEIGKSFVDGRTYGRTYWRTFQTPTNVIRLTRRSRPKSCNQSI